MVMEDPNAVTLGQVFVEAIMKDYLPIPNSDGMQVLCDVTDLETEESGHVVLRTITEDFWAKVIETTERFRVCALGTPGIGKSLTTCILIRLLLKQSKTVVYRVRTDENVGRIFIFTPVKHQNTNNTGIHVGTVQERSFFPHQIKEPLSTYYVVDPGQTKVNCNPPVDFKGKVVIVASPDESYWGKSEFGKDRRSVSHKFLYFPVWTLKELLDASPYLSKPLNTVMREQEIRNRFYRFGGVPRIIFSDAYDETKVTQSKAIDDLSDSQALPLAFKKRSAIITLSTDLPRGILLAYTLSDTDNGMYSDGYAVLCSDYVYESIAKAYMFKLCKKLFYDDILPLQQLNVTIRNHGTASTERNQTEDITLTRCQRMEKVDDPIASSTREPLVLFCPISARNQLFDFVYQEHDTFYIFQCTIARSHTVRRDHIYNLVVGAVSERVAQIPPMPHFVFFFMVPDFRFDEFVTEHVEANAEARDYCRLQLGPASFLYVNWNNVVSLRIMKVLQPNGPGWTR
jgi:hypothetical protein